MNSDNCFYHRERGDTEKNVFKLKLLVLVSVYLMASAGIIIAGGLSSTENTVFLMKFGNGNRPEVSKDIVAICKGIVGGDGFDGQGGRIVRGESYIQLEFKGKFKLFADSPGTLEFFIRPEFSYDRTKKMADDGRTFHKIFYSRFPAFFSTTRWENILLLKNNIMGERGTHVTAPGKGKWSHVAYCWTFKTDEEGQRDFVFYLFVNGKKSRVITQDYETTISKASDILVIGNGPDINPSVAGGEFSGGIDEIRISDKALYTAEFDAEEL